MTEPRRRAYPGRSAAAEAEYRAQGFWQDETVGDMVRHWAHHRPDAPAYIVADSAVTWAQHDHRASHLAGVLAGLGTRRSDRVAVLMPDGSAVHTAFVANERAGLTTVGIGHRAGDREILHLLEKTGAHHLITSPQHRGEPAAALIDRVRQAGVRIEHHLTLPEPGAGDLLVDGQAPAPSVASDVDGRALRAGDLFLINSTSGTTGLPKCVMHDQYRWTYFHQLAVDAGDLTGDDVVCGLVPAPFGFGIWTAHVTPSLLGTATVVLPRFDADAALQMIERERVTVLACVSTQFILMLNSAGAELRDLSSLRCMFTGGEAVPFEQAARFEELTGARVLQFYGSNETGALSRTTLTDTQDQRLRTAGQIIPEMHVRLIGADGTEVTEPGAVGEPICQGPATCLGYLDDDEANAQLFTDDGSMRIGDLCRIGADGYLEVVGRTSDIIIRGGKNISAPAVEAEILTHPAVAVAAAVAMPDPTFGERVCAYVELRPDVTDLTLSALVEHLDRRGVSKEWFPEALLVLPSLPRSSGGKVAKGDLRDDIRERLQRAGS